MSVSSKIYAGTIGERDLKLDHGTLIPLRFLEQAGINFNETKVMRIGLSGLSATEHYKFGQLISKTASTLNRRVLMSGALDRKDIECERLSYQGTFSVGYGITWIDIKGEDQSRNIGVQLEQANRKKLNDLKKNEDEFVKLAHLMTLKDILLSLYFEYFSDNVN